MNSRSQGGNVLFLILIAVVLFAALSYAVTNSTRSSGNATSEKLKISASQIVQFSAAVQTAVQRMRTIGGTEETQFEWQTNVYKQIGGTLQFTSGINPNDRPNGVDNILDPRGGGVSPVTFESVTDPTGLGSDTLTPGHANLHQFSVQNVGTTAPELLLIVERLNTDVCMEINNKLGVTNNVNSPPADNFNPSPFGGAYNSVASTTNSALTGKMAFCLEAIGSAIDVPGRPDNFFFTVLIAR